MSKSSRAFLEERERNQFLEEVDESDYQRNLHEQEHFSKLVTPLTQKADGERNELLGNPCDAQQIKKCDK